ncbi:hypothetical protein V8G54_009749 [Vigna mungo]|uniref:Uncharacterized protein n=1 Tax=Vigna mungo TaxID=3915 RepID=A0AAQ3NXC3_VIGMU
MDEYELFLRNGLHFFLQHTLLPAATLGVYHTQSLQVLRQAEEGHIFPCGNAQYQSKRSLHHYQYRAEEEGIKVAGHSSSQPYQVGPVHIDLMQHHQRQPTTKKTGFRFLVQRRTDVIGPGNI